MKVNVLLGQHICEVIREDGDPRFSRGGWGDAESTFLYHVKQNLIKQGYDVIKKRMWKDGHMVDDARQYIRTRKLTNDSGFMIYNNNWAIEDAGEEFNKQGFYNLTLDFQFIVWYNKRKTGDKNA